MVRVSCWFELYRHSCFRGNDIEPRNKTLKNKHDQKHYICSNCGNISPKWSGQCFDCGVWGSIVEEIVSANQARDQ